MSKKKVLHISTECYPAAKAGGMADVVGALPKYLISEGWSPSVIDNLGDVLYELPDIFSIRSRPASARALPPASAPIA